jgi:hypothetical protein
MPRVRQAREAKTGSFTMKRIVLRALAFLLLGATITVAVAWACVYWAPLRALPFSETGWPSYRGWPVKVPNEWGESDTFTNYAERGLGIVRAEAGVMLRDYSRKKYLGQLAIRIDAGWPRMALTAFLVTESDMKAAQSSDATVLNWSGGFAAGGMRAPIGGEMALPFKPLWAGFAFNCGFFGLLAWLALGAPRTARHYLRGRRGQCHACGYPVGTSPICTECGKPIKSRVAT